MQAHIQMQPQRTSEMFRFGHHWKICRPPQYFVVVSVFMSVFQIYCFIVKIIIMRILTIWRQRAIVGICGAPSQQPRIDHSW